MDTSFRIGNLQLPHRYVQAPLAGISCAPFRALFSLYTKPAYAVTEMISAHSVLYKPNIHRRYLTRAGAEGLWCVQLSGNDPALMFDAVQAVEHYKPNLIDLNCGCPKPKIRAKGAGSALLDNPLKLRRIVSAMRDATNLPLTVKIRVEPNNISIANMLEDVGADAIIVHGRDHTEDYETPADYKKIRDIVDAVSIPIIANGDVTDNASAAHCFNETKADAIMLGRGAIGNPWVFKQLLEDNFQPSSTDRLYAFRQHIDSLTKLELSETTALFQARRLLKWYFPMFSKDILAGCYQVPALATLYSLLQELF